MPLFATSATPIRPSAATRPAFFAAFANPFLRSQSTAGSILPPVSVSAALQSIMPAPVWSRSSFTICEVIFAIAVSLGLTREQPGTWVTVLTGDMGNTFLVLFSPAVAVVGPVGLWGTRQGSPQVHGPGALACADDRRHAR